MRRAIALLSFALGLILSILLLMGDELVMVIIIGPGLGLLIMGMATLVLAITGLDQRWRRRGLDDPPPGYASHTADPCGLYTAPTRVRFYNEAYHAQFATLNPEWAWQPKS